MARLNKDRSLLLDKLIGDCIIYSLNLQESMEYIKKENTLTVKLKKGYFSGEKEDSTQTKQ